MACIRPEMLELGLTVAVELTGNSSAQIRSCQPIQRYVYCNECQKAWKEPETSRHPNHSGDSIDFPGVQLVKNFVNHEEEKYLVEEIDKTPWTLSQSGRRKQDYGPKVNFKKKKLKTSVFTGLPKLSKFLVERMHQMKSTKNFIPVELCHLEYTPERGSAIDPHFDDFWLWGERLITLNLLSETVHTMTIDLRPDTEVDIILPPRCLIIATGAARYDWLHGIKRENIKARRIAMTFREFSPEFLGGGCKEALGKDVIALSLRFNGVAVGVR